MIGRNRQDFTVNFRKINFIVFFFWYNWLNIDDFQLFSNELGESKRRKMYEKAVAAAAVKMDTAVQKRQRWHTGKHIIRLEQIR